MCLRFPLFPVSLEVVSFLISAAQSWGFSLHLAVLQSNSITDACTGAHCFQGAVIKKDAFWAGSLVPLSILATWSQSVPCLAEAPSDEGNLKYLFGLFCQLRCCVRLNKEHNLGLTTDDIRSEKTLENIVAEHTAFLKHLRQHITWAPGKLSIGGHPCQLSARC